MIIYTADGSTALNTEVDDNSYRQRSIMGDHNVTLYFSLPEHVEIPIGAYIVYEGQTYTLMRPEALKMQHSRQFDYTIIFESQQSKTKIWKFRNPVDGRLQFSLTAKPHEHLQMFVDNMNQRDGAGEWSIGEGCLDAVEKCVTYDHDFCWDALGKMATEFETEFEIIGKVVYLRKVEYNHDDPLALSYGQGNGLKPGVGRANTADSVPIEILHVQGGDRNIDPSKYNGAKNLHLPCGETLSYDGRHFEDEDGFVAADARTYRASTDGLSLRNISTSPTTMAEESLDLTDIYPKREGYITHVECVDDGKHFWDFTDEDIPDALNYEECLIAGETLTVVFQSGELAGREFEVKYHHEAVGLPNHKEGRRFEIVPQEVDGVTMPGGTFIPHGSDEGGEGDRYAVYGCALPQAYINANHGDNPVKQGAEWDMMREAVSYLYDNEEQKYTISGQLDGIWAKTDWANSSGKIRLGGYVSFTDPRFQPTPIQVRITAVKDYVNDPHSPEIELSNETATPGFASTLSTLKATEVTVNDYRRDAINYTKRRWRDAKETMAMLAAALDGYSEGIQPVAVQTMQLLVGDERLQFQFVLEDLETSTPLNPSWTATDGLSIHACYMRCLDPEASKNIGSATTAKPWQYWRVSALSVAPSAIDAAKPYYLYIIANENPARLAPSPVLSKVVFSGKFRLTTDALPFKGDGLHNYLVGILNSEADGERSFVSLYGFTEILPGRVTTDRIVCADGQSFIDLVNSALRLKDKLIFNHNGDGRLVLKGTLVQNGSDAGAVPIGCFRGLWDASVVYYEGDEVAYEETTGVISTYRYINAEASLGHEPTDTGYWQVTAAGVKGADGTGVRILGTSAGLYATMADALDNVPTRLYALVVANEESNDEPGWYVYNTGRFYVGQGVRKNKIKAALGDAFINQADGHLYVCGEDGWLDVGQIKGDPGANGQPGANGNYTEFRYNVNGYTTLDQLAAAGLWSDTVRAKVDPTSDGWAQTYDAPGQFEYLWLIQAVKTADGNTKLTNWSVPVRITAVAGVKGKGVSDIQEQYALSNSANVIIINWQTSIPQMTPTYRYLWNRERVVYDDGSFGDWTSQTLIGVYGQQGNAGKGIASITNYYLATDAETGVTINTPGWTTAVQSMTEAKPYLYNYEVIRYSDGTITTTTPHLIGRYGKDGTNGQDGATVAVIFRGEFSSAKTYYGSRSRLDIVHCGNAYYITTTTTGETSESPLTATTKWNNFGATFENIATGFMFAEGANIANLLFQNQRLESVGRTNGVPNFFLDGLNNIASFAAGNVEFSADRARIGWLTLIGDDLVGYDEQGEERLRITPQNLPSIANAATTSILTVQDHGTDTETIWDADTSTEVAFYRNGGITFQRSGHDGNETAYDNTITAWVYYDIAEPFTKLLLGDIQAGVSYVRDLNGNAITNGLYANVYIHVEMVHGTGAAQTLTSVASINLATASEVTIPEAGRIKLSFAVDGHAGYGEQSWTGRIFLATQGIRAQTTKTETFIGRDGILSIFNQNFLRFSSNEGFEVQYGSNGIKVDNSGVTYKVRGVNKSLT